ncbi:retrotransposon protein, putative, ty1-copia subclass [Tanacetum coccineum]
MLHQHLPKSFWGYAFESTGHILNMVLTKKVDRTSYEIWYGKAPKMSYLRVWGCEALVKRDTPDKLDYRSIKCIFVGYLKETMVYYFYYPLKNKIFVARNAEFFENSLTLHKVSGSHGLLEASGSDVGLELIQEDDTQSFENNSKIHDEHELGDLNEPPNYKVALSNPESEKWLDVMNTEMQSIKDNQVWCLVDLPPNGRTIGSKWLFKKKTDMDGNVHTFKAHLVAKGFTQIYGVDYRETFSLVADIRVIRILLAISAFYDYGIWQMDVKIAFLNGHLSEDVYVCNLRGLWIQNIPANMQTSTFHLWILEARTRDLMWKSRRLVSLKILMSYVYISKLVGVISIMYVVRCTRPDVAFAQNLCSRFQQNPDDVHWIVVKRYVFVLNGGAVDGRVLSEALLLCLLQKSGTLPVEMFCDNAPSIAIANDPDIMRGAKHYQRKYHYIRELIQGGEIVLKKVHTDDNLADPFTKSMPYNKHFEHAMGIGVCPTNSLM